MIQARLNKLNKVSHTHSKSQIINYASEKLLKYFTRQLFFLQQFTNYKTMFFLQNGRFWNFSFESVILSKINQWKGINRKQSTWWQRLSRLKASAFFSLQNVFSCYETQQLILGTGTAIWRETEPHYKTCFPK